MIVRFTYWMLKDWTTNDRTTNDRTSKDSISNDWTSNDWTSNRTQRRNRDPITNDWTSNRTQCRKTEHWIWTPKDWTSKNSTASYYDIIVEFLKWVVFYVGVTFSKFSRSQVGSFVVRSFEVQSFEWTNLGTTELWESGPKLEYDFQLRIWTSNFEKFWSR